MVYMGVTLSAKALEKSGGNIEISHETPGKVRKNI